MSELTEIFKRDHAALLSALQSLKTLGLSHPETPRKLVLAKAALLAHLKHEEEELYPVLHEAAATDLQIRAKLKVLAVDLEGLAKEALAFFGKYELGGDPEDFKTDLHNIEFAVKTRIRREEHSLYPLYEILAQKKSVAS